MNGETIGSTPGHEITVSFKPHKVLKKRFAYEWKKGIGPVFYVRLGRKRIGFCLCHHKKDKTVKFFGLEKYLCSRDLGILFGAIAGAALYFVGYCMGLLAAIALATPMVVDGTTQLMGWRKSNNLLRLTTGFMFGVGVICMGALSNGY